MTVRLLRAFNGRAAGMAYSGSPEVEADLLRNGNADTNLNSVEAEPSAESAGGAAAPETGSEVQTDSASAEAPEGEGSAPD